MNPEIRVIPVEMAEHRRRARATALFRQLRKLVRTADRVIVDLAVVADGLDDAPPELHPFKTTAEDRASDWAALDLRATARALDLMLADVRAVVK